jgi:formate-dependent nitrite reductase membrane component NrfD
MNFLGLFDSGATASAPIDAASLGAVWIGISLLGLVVTMLLWWASRGSAGDSRANGIRFPLNRT